MMAYRTGIGYDVHRFAKGRKLMLGGIEIPHDRGLDGHSDADVVLHAVCDALLGAVGQGDIGEHFPPGDKKYKGISSLVLLEKVSQIVFDAGFKAVNVDAVILAEEPKVNNYKPLMKMRIAKILKLEESCVNIKATTTEGLGAIGRKEGIAVYATVLLCERARRKI